MAEVTANTRLFWDTCATGSLSQVLLIATDDIDPNWPNPMCQGMVPLSIACHRRHVLLVQHLLSLPNLDASLVEIPPYRNQALRDPELLEILHLLLDHQQQQSAGGGCGGGGENSSRLFDWALHHHDTRLLARLLARPDFVVPPKALFSAGGVGEVDCPLVLQQLLEHPATPLDAPHPTLYKTAVEYACFFGNLGFLQFLLASGRSDVAQLADDLLHAVETQEYRVIYMCRECLQLLHQWKMDPRGTLINLRSSIGWLSGAAGLYCLATLVHNGEACAQRTNRGLQVLTQVNDNLRMVLAHRGCGNTKRDILLSRDILAAENQLMKLMAVQR